MTQKNAGDTAGSNQASHQDELDGLRASINSLSLRGDYPGCIKLIEANLRVLYENERWPDVFFSIMRTYQRCYPSLQKTQSLEERLIPLLEENAVPYVFALLLRVSDSSISWKSDYFKNLASQAERSADYKAALSYCDILIKLNPGSSSSFVLRGWILDDLERHKEAEEMFEQAIELNDANHSAYNSLAKHLADKKPALALEQIEKAIELAPTEGSYYDTKAKILLRLNDRDGAVACYDLAMSSSPYVADYPYYKAEIFLADGKEMVAIALYRKAMGLDEKHLPSLWRLASLYKDSQPELALTYANTIASLDPENQAVILLRGALLSALGEDAAAAVEFKQLMGVDPTCHEALAGYANLILNDDPGGAIGYYDRAIALSPKNAGYHTGKARAYEKLGDIPMAIKEYRTVVALDKSNYRAYGRMGALLADTKPREAADCYTKAIGIMPDNAYYYAAKADILMNLPGGKSEAISCLVSASKYDPANGQLHLLLAGLLEESGNAASAAEHYKQAIGFGAGNAAAFHSLAKLIFPTEPETALLHINSAISLDDMNGEYYYFKSKVLNELGHDKNALEQLRESLRANGKNTDALNEISAMLSSDSPDVALMYINRAIDLAPGSKDYLLSRANLLFGMGKYMKALAGYEEVIKIDPKNGEPLYGVGRCFAAMNDDRALEYYDKAISTSPDAAYLAAKGAFLASKDDISGAIEAYESSLAADGENREYMLGLAKLLEKSGRPHEACEYYKKILARGPECMEAVGRLGVLLAEESPRDALEYLDRAIEAFPEEYMYHAWRGGALLAIGNTDAAAAEYLRAASLGGETAETYFTLAGILAEKLPETALGYCLRAINEDGANAAYHLLCGKIYLTLNQIGGAIERFKTAIALDPGCHEAFEGIANIFYNRGDPSALEAVNSSLMQNPDCAGCLLLQAKILDERIPDSDVDEIIGILDHALGIAPNLIPAREKLIELLGRKRAFMRLALEKRKLSKLGAKHGGKK